MTIREKIYNYFASRTDLRVLFVFDPMSMVRYEIEQCPDPWPEDYVYQIFEGNWFTTKVKLAGEWKEKKVVLVFRQMEPNTQDTCINFPLMSALKANMVFHEEDAVAFMQQRGIPMEYADFFKRHITELLRDKFNKVFAPIYNTTALSFDTCYRGILSAYLDSAKLLEWYQIIARIIILCDNEDATKANAFWGKFSSGSKIRANDVQLALKEKIMSLVGFSYDEMSGSPMKKVAEAMKYNAITQLLAVNEADPYKQLKIQNGVRLQELNTILSSITENTKLYETFAPAFDHLAQNIKEETLLDAYGTDAHYSFLSEKMSREMAHRLIKENLYSHPDEVDERLQGLENNAFVSDSFKQVMVFYSSLCKFYSTVNSIGTLKLNTPDFYIARYTDQFYLLDMYYRQAVCAYAELDLASKTEMVEQAKAKLELDYASIINELNLEWVRCIKELGTGFETVTSIERQPDFFKNRLQNQKQKMSVIVSDALRYEMARELMQQLTGKKHVATLTPTFAMLPTETKYCKPSLLPHDTLTCTGEDMEVDGKVSASTESRTAQLQKHNEDSLCISYKQLMALSKTEKREVFKHKLVYVFHNTLDENCHGCSLKTFASTCKDVFDELVQLVTFIHDQANVTEVFITADHGFLYNDMAFEEKDKQTIMEDSTDKTTRYYICHSDVENTGITKFPLQSVSALKGDYYIGVPTGTNRLSVKGGDYTFAHGGASLEELVIPVIHSRYKRVNAKQKVSVSLLEPTLTIASSRLKAHLVQGEAVSMDMQELTVQCAVYVGDEAVTPIKTITLNSTDAEMGASRIYEVDLTVTQSATSKIMQFKVFKKDDLLNPVIEKNIVNNTLIEQDDF